MPLPQTVRVKLSSEVAEAISLTPVLLQELPIRELVEHMLAVTGKDEPRIREILLRGTLVSGATRFRWAGWEQDLESLRDLLRTFPDPEPERPFSPERCTHVILRGGRQAIEISRDAGEKTGLFRRRSFWRHLLEEVSASPMSYSGYSYRHRADRYLRQFTLDEQERLRAAAEAVQFSTLRDQIRLVAFANAELYATR